MLKATGYVRPIDELGRVVLPIRIRRERGLEPKADIEFYVDGDSIVVQRYLPGCLFCGEREGLSTFRGKLVCQACATTIGQSSAAAD